MIIWFDLQKQKKTQICLYCSNLESFPISTERGQKKKSTVWDFFLSFFVFFFVFCFVLENAKTILCLFIFFSWLVFVLLFLITLSLFGNREILCKQYRYCCSFLLLTLYLYFLYFLKFFFNTLKMFSSEQKMQWWNEKNMEFLKENRSLCLVEFRRGNNNNNKKKRSLNIFCLKVS